MGGCAGSCVSCTAIWNVLTSVGLKSLTAGVDNGNTDNWVPGDI